jgi:hypothetical protein
VTSIHMRRALVAVSSALFAISALAVPVGAKDTRMVFIGSAADGALPSAITISGGETIPFVLTVKNPGPQVLNNVLLNLGQDDRPSIVEANPQHAIVPTQPTDLPSGVIVSAAGADAATAHCNAGGSLLSCAIGTLAARQALNINVTISTTESTAAAVVPLKAVVTVAEIGNDQGANVDTFAAEGGLTVIAFSCDSIAAYRGIGQNKTVSTCGLDRADNANFQSASVTIPSRLTQVTLSEGEGPACPVGFTCYGETISADIAGDSPSDVISWTIQVNLTENALPKPNLQQLVVIHFTDEGVESPVGGISLDKKNACKSASSINCGSASLTTAADGDLILNVNVQTDGNGNLRLQ